MPVENLSGEKKKKKDIRNHCTKGVGWGIEERRGDGKKDLRRIK